MKLGDSYRTSNQCLHYSGQMGLGVGHFEALAAQDHCKDIGPKGLQGKHGTGTQGDSYMDRIRKYGIASYARGDAHNFGALNPAEIIKQILIDDGTK